jgi:hypothetical protein
MRYSLESELPINAFQPRGGRGPFSRGMTLEGGGKGGGSSTTVVNQQQTPTLTQEQKDMLAAQTDLYKNTINPSFQKATTGATDIYNTSAGGYNNAAQNYAGIAGQAQEVLGRQGETALNTGMGGLTSLFDNNYMSDQMQAAMMPAQAQYMKNIADQGSQFGGAGQIGSARQALAQGQLASSNLATQQAIAAQVANNVQNQRMGVGQFLVGAGQTGLNQAQAAGANQLAAAGAPMNLYNQYASTLFGVPQSSYNPNFSGTQGTNTTGTTQQNYSKWDVNARFSGLPGLGG